MRSGFSWLPHSHDAALIVAVGLLVAITLAKQVQDLATRMLRAYVLERLTLDLRARLFLHAQRLSLTHHDRQGTMDATYRIQKDVPDAQSIIVESVFPSFAAALSLVGMFVVTARIDAQLALVAITVAPVLLLMNQYYRGRFRRRSTEVLSLETTAIGIVQEALGALRVVKAFGQERREQERFVRRSSEGMWARLKMWLVESGYSIWVSLVTVAGTSFVLYVGVRHVQTGRLTLGALLMVMGYLTQLYEPLKTMSRRAAMMQGKLASAERVFTLLDRDVDVGERPDARPVGHAIGHIELDHVSFGYDADRVVLRDVSVVIPAGARVGIAGPTGSGKTTLVNLLLRLYDATEGRILLDGVDVRALRLDDLRRQYAMVLQDPVLFSTTVAENIAYARPDASRNEIVDAARAANAHDFITRLPEGYDTPVGERGMTLSGGERQRVSLARAFLKNAPILVLDEPTSAVDLGSEALIMEALERLVQGRTTLMIAHRLSTLEACDLRLELAHGQLVDVRSAAETRSAAEGSAVTSRTHA
jgi:ATP-binding cassette subfamily B protein